MKTVFLVLGIGLTVLMAVFVCASVIVAADADRRMNAWEQKKDAGRD